MATLRTSSTTNNDLPPLAEEHLIRPEWNAPANVAALVTTRRGGVSMGPYASFNLGVSSGDEPGRVVENRRRLEALLPGRPLWLRQVHGTEVVYAPDALRGRPRTPVEILDDNEDQADASWTDRPNQVLAILTADCLPILFCHRHGQWVAAAHGGWRGLSAGIIHRVVEALPSPPRDMLAWLGPAISAGHYEVGEEVYREFADADLLLGQAFQFNGNGWQADLYAIARRQLYMAGVAQVTGGNYCTYAQSENFYSFRRDRQTGRQAACIWLKEQV